MKNLTRLRNLRGQKLAEARGYIDKITDDTSETDANEHRASADAVLTELTTIDADVRREEALEARERAAEAFMSSSAVQVPGAAGSLDLGSVNGEIRSVNALFGLALRFNDWQNQLVDGEAAVMAELRAQSVGTGSEGGYLVPQGFSGEIDKALAAWGPMLDGNVTRLLTTETGNALPWPTVDDTAKRGALNAENAAVPDTGAGDVVIGEKVLNAYVYSSDMIRVSWEMLADSHFSVEELLRDLIGERLGRSANDVLTVGDGINKPNGIVNAATSAFTTAAIGVVTFDEIIDLFHSVDPAYRRSPSAVWQMNDTTFKTVAKFKDGQGNYLLSQGDVKAADTYTIKGKRVEINQAMADVASSATPIIFGDHSKYVVRRVGGMVVSVLRERFAEKFQNGFMGHQRLDGDLMNTAAVKKLTIRAV